METTTGHFYLPESVKMQVIGIVKDKSLPCDGLVLMTCEDKKVYGFDGDELHLMAEELQLIEGKGVITYPGSEAYYRGEAFKDKTEVDWDEVKRSDVGRRLDEEHRKLVEQHAPKLIKILKSIRD